MRTIYATLTVKVVVKADDDLNLGEFFGNLDVTARCHRIPYCNKGDFETVDVESVEVTDSK